MSGPLFDYADRYPLSPGHKGRRGTSEKAAREMRPKAPSLRDYCLGVFEKSRRGLTADEVAAELGKSVLSIRPRVAELARMNLIVDTGVRRENVSGKLAVVWSRVNAA